MDALDMSLPAAEFCPSENKGWSMWSICGVNCKNAFKETSVNVSFTKSGIQTSSDRSRGARRGRSWLQRIRIIQTTGWTCAPIFRGRPSSLHQHPRALSRSHSHSFCLESSLGTRAGDKMAKIEGRAFSRALHGKKTFLTYGTLVIMLTFKRKQTHQREEEPLFSSHFSVLLPCSVPGPPRQWQHQEIFSKSSAAITILEESS